MSRKDSIRIWPRSLLARYGASLAAAAAAVATRVALDPLLGPHASFATAYPAVVVSSALGGPGPGLVTTLACAAAVLVVGTPPAVSLASPADIAGLTLFLLGGGMISTLTGALAGVARRAEASRSRLEQEILDGRRAEEALVTANQELERRLADRDDLVAREQAARAVAQRRQRDAEAASRAKDEFMAVLGHELRNPLGAISNAVRALHDTGDKVVKLQDIIGRQSRHLARLLDDMLDVSRATMGKIALQREPVDLMAIAQRALASLQHENRTGEHEIDLAGDSVVVHGDPIRLEQVVRNLLDNALKYTPAGGRIEARIGYEDADAVLRVSDTGAGIPHDVLPRVFEPFVQADGTLERSLGGLGLGLSVVKHLVELHGGSVSVSSEGPGRGSEFLVRLPLLAEGAPPPEPPVAATPKSTARRVLIVEDNADVRDGLRMLLETWGHAVEEAADGGEGLELARLDRPDVALVDVGLPVLDGYAVARAIRGDPQVAGIVLVAVTGYGQPADMERARAAGFDAVLVKPIDPDALVRALARVDDPH